MGSDSDARGPAYEPPSTTRRYRRNTPRQNEPSLSEYDIDMSYTAPSSPPQDWTPSIQQETSERGVTPLLGPSIRPTSSEDPSLIYECVTDAME